MGWFQVCGAIAIAIAIAIAKAPCYSVGSPIWDLYEVCCITGNQLLGSQDP